MRKLLLQQASRGCLPLLNMAYAVHADYARKHGFEYIVSYAPEDCEPFGTTSENKQWLRRQLREIEDGAFITFLDADVLIQKPEVNLISALPPDMDLALLGDERFVNSGVMFMQNSQLLRKFFEEVFALGPISNDNNLIDSRIRPCLRHGCLLRVSYLHDRWNFFDSWQGQPRAVKCLREEANIVAWHGQPKNDVVPQMREAIRNLKGVAV